MMTMILNGCLYYSIMGGITRLLDFTYSFYIAMYFAIESSIDDGCIWCINKEALTQYLLDTHLAKYKSSTDAIAAVDRHKDILWEDGRITASQYIGKKDVDNNFVVPVRPYKINERMAIQQGIFLFPSNITIDFQTNLSTTFGANNMDTIEDRINVFRLDKYNIVKLVIPKQCHREILFDLKKMNITTASLFPGLDGYAKSLKSNLRFFEDGELRAVMSGAY